MKPSFTLKPMLFLLGLAATAPAFAVSYSITDLGAAINNDGAYAINASGVVAGTYSDLATVWTGGIPSALSADQSRAYGINASGQVVGGLTDAVTTIESATLWNNGVAQTLGTGVANAINNAGDVVGNSQGQATLWSAGSATALNGLFTNGATAAQSINTAGQIVGYSDINALQDQHAVLWQSGTHAATDLGTLGGSSSQAWGVNDQGLVVGLAADAQNAMKAVYWNGANATDLGLLSGATGGGAWGVNNNGLVVGSSSFGTYQSATLWQIVNGVVSSRFDLNALLDPAAATGWQLDSAYAVNDQGQITGYGFLNGTAHSFLLTAVAAVPENDTSTMLISGLGLLGFMVRRRMSAQA